MDKIIFAKGFLFYLFFKRKKMSPVFFALSQEFRDWLHTNHATEKEIIVGFYKVSSGKPSMTWSESVDEAICFGWIDGIRRSFDADSYTIRFTPRLPKSIWSAVNIKKVEMLIEKGLMQTAGILAYGKRDDKKSAIYAYETQPAVLPEDWEKLFKDNAPAWDFFQSQAPWYKQNVIYRVISAKQKTTQYQRLLTLIEDSANGLRIKSQRR